MIISFSRDYGTVTVSIDENNREQDIRNCQRLEKLHMSDEWITLLELMAQVETIYDETVMKVKSQEQSFRETAIYAARKNGFCEAMKLLGKAVKTYQTYREEQKKIINDQVNQILGQQQEEISFSD